MCKFLFHVTKWEKENELNEDEDKNSSKKKREAAAAAAIIYYYVINAFRRLQATSIH